MSAMLLFLAPLVTGGGMNIGNVYGDCLNRAAISVLWSGTPENVADSAMGKCRYLEPQLRDGLDRSWRTDRSGNVAPANDVSRLMTAQSWDRLMQSRRNRLIQDVQRARQSLRK